MGSPENFPAPIQTFEPDGLTLERYLTSQARVRLIQGPRGSGKSSSSCVTLMMNAQSQAPCADGIRRTRFYAVRNTFDELARTTLATWKGMFPENVYGPVKGTRPMVHTLRKNDIEMEVTFLALDDPEDVKKLLSTDVTGLWLNEFRELDRRILDEASAIIGRYPNKQMVKGGCTRPMIVGDTNAPPETHWFSMMSGQVPIPSSIGPEERERLVKPDSWEIFIQPPGLIEVKDTNGDVTGYVPNPAAENLKWLPENYYLEMVKGKDRSWVAVNVLNKPGASRHGKPVWPQFKRETHVAKKDLEPIPGHPIMVGVDFGRTPAAAFGQRLFGSWRILRELCARQMAAKEFARLLKGVLGEEFAGFPFLIWGDPAGEHLTEADDISPFLMFRSEGLRILPAPSNDPTIRINAVAEMLNTRPDVAGGITISPGCVHLIGAMEGGYQYRRLQTTGEVYSEKPNKDDYSHISDALQYLVVGAGEGRALVNQGLSGGGGRVRVMPRPRGTVFDRYRVGRR